MLRSDPVKRPGYFFILSAMFFLLPRLAAAQSMTVATVSTATNGPRAVAMDGTGAKYVAEYGGGRVLKFNQDGSMTTLATLNPLTGIAVTNSGMVYVSDATQNRILQITPDGTVSTLAGGTQGSLDGNGTAAQFNVPCGLVFAPWGTLYVADRDNHRIRQINTKTGDVTTLAGSTQGFLDAGGTAAQFNAPAAVAADYTGIVYVADAGNARIRRIAWDGTVTTLAGNGTPGFANGPASTAEFMTPKGIAVDPAGWLYVSDTGNNRIRQIAPDGSVTTLAGTGVSGFADGDASSAQFASPMGLVVGGHGAVFVADIGNSMIRKIASTAAAPTVTAVSPSSGPAAGGTLVTITGTGFATGATVAFVGIPGINPTVVDPSTITVTTPAHGVGTNVVTVRNPDGQLTSIYPGYSYYLLPSSIALGALDQTFNGTPRVVTVTTTPPGLPVTLSYMGTGMTVYGPSSTAPTGAGAYVVTAIIIDTTYAGSTMATLTVTLLPVVPVDLGGSGKSGIVVFRASSGQWFINGQADPVTFGQAGDIPVVADYNGDGKAELAVYRPSTAEWIVQGQAPFVFGQTGDVPVPGDYNGDGKAERAIFRPSTGEWMIDGQPGMTMWGMRGDIPVPADFNGDGVTELAVFRPTTGVWYVVGGTTLEWGMWGDVPVPGDYSGVGHAQIAIYRPSTGWWYVANGPFAHWGVEGDLPVTLDVDGDGKTEFVVFRPSDGTWYAYNPTTDATTSVAWGQAGDTPVGEPHLPYTPVPKTAGDFDHDGTADLTVFRPSNGTWYTLKSTSGYHDWVGVTFGQDGDVPVPGDYQGTGTQERAVYRPSTGQWLLEDGRTFTLGAPGDVPVPADYDGDGIMDVAVFTPGTAQWSVLTSASGFTELKTKVWGQPGDLPVPGDYDADGKADLAVFTPVTGMWTIWGTSAQAPLMTVQWGMSGDIPVQADYDGDGKTDLGIYRPSTGYWYGLMSTTGYTNFQYVLWGAVGDIPVPGDYNGDGRAEPAVYRPSNGAWYVMDVMTIMGWGAATDVPILGRK